MVGEEAAKFKAALERAAKVGVENLTKKDIDGQATNRSRNSGD